jgi:hypothetical protein
LIRARLGCSRQLSDDQSWITHRCQSRQTARLTQRTAHCVGVCKACCRIEGKRLIEDCADIVRHTQIQVMGRLKRIGVAGHHCGGAGQRIRRRRTG